MSEFKQGDRVMVTPLHDAAPSWFALVLSDSSANGRTLILPEGEGDKRHVKTNVLSLATSLPTYLTDDGKTVREGDTVFSHYTFTTGTIGEADGRGWFTFVHPDGRELLNGQRICSLDHAGRMGWLK